MILSFRYESSLKYIEQTFGLQKLSQSIVCIFDWVSVDYWKCVKSNFVIMNELFNRKQIVGTQKTPLFKQSRKETKNFKNSIKSEIVFPIWNFYDEKEFFLLNLYKNLWRLIIFWGVWDRPKMTSRLVWCFCDPQGF